MTKTSYGAMALSEEKIKEIFADLEKNLDYETICKEVEDLKERFPIIGKKKEKFPAHLFKFWLLRAMYLRGYAHGMERARKLTQEWEAKAAEE